MDKQFPVIGGAFLSSVHNLYLINSGVIETEEDEGVYFE